MAAQRAAEGNAFAAGFEVEAVLQFEVERAVDVERVNRAFHWFGLC